MGEADIPKRLVTFPLHLWQLNFIRSFIHSIHYSFILLLFHLLLFTSIVLSSISCLPSCVTPILSSAWVLFPYTLSSAIKVCIVALPFPRCV